MTEESTHYNEFVLMFHFLRRLCFVISGIFNAFRSDESARIIQQTTALENCSKLLASSPSARNRVCVCLFPQRISRVSDPSVRTVQMHGNALEISRRMERNKINVENRLFYTSQSVGRSQC